MPPPFHKDLGKNADDLLNKNFPTKLEFEINAPSPSDSLNFKVSAVRDASGIVSASLKPSYAVQQAGFELSTTLHSTKELIVEASAKIVDGVKGLLKAKAPQFDSRDKLSVNAEVQYTHPQAAVTVSADVLSAKDPLVKTTAVYSANDQLNVGGEVEATISSAPKVTSNAITLGYATPSWKTADSILSLYRRGGANFPTYGLSFWRAPGPAGLFLGSHVAYDVKDEKTNLPRMDFGGSYELAPDVTLKAKYGTSGRLGFALGITNKLSNLKFNSTLGLDVNSIDPSENTLGFKLEAKQ